MTSSRTHRRLVAILALTGLGLAACGSDDATTTDASVIAPTETAAPSASSDDVYDNPPATDAPTVATEPADTEPAATEPAVAGGVQVVDTEIGEVLADADGFTLYIFTNDIAGESTCLEGCIDTWPAAVGEPSTVGGVELVTITRPDGVEQLAVGDLPLYTYAGDAAPGDTTGQAVGDVWFAIGADGQPIS